MCFWTNWVFLVLLSAVAVETWIKPGVFSTDYSPTVVYKDPPQFVSLWPQLLLDFKLQDPVRTIFCPER